MRRTVMMAAMKKDVVSIVSICFCIGNNYAAFVL